ncbi:MAG TPA: hypothetical protein VIT00_14710 [Terrimicrobiaceae bacterium]
MNLNESIVEDAALEWFGELGYAVGHGPQLAPGEPAAERDSFGEVVCVPAERGDPAAARTCVFLNLANEHTERLPKLRAGGFLANAGRQPPWPPREQSATAKASRHDRDTGIQ